MHSIHEKLAAGLAALQVTATVEQQKQLLDFISQLKKWNRTYNLVADASDEVLLYRHLLDSIAITPYVNAHCILDIGSGGGFPGIPLAILKPDSRFILLDSNGKKTRFLFQVKAALQLDNVEVQNCRVEHYQSDTQIDIVTCRAFSTLRDILDKTATLLSPQSHLLAMKGQLPDDEISDLGDQYEVANIVKLKIPAAASESAAQRHLIDIIPR